MRTSGSATGTHDTSHDEPLVALFVPDLNGGGAERVMVSVANGLQRRNIRVDLVLARAQGTYLKDVAPEVRVVNLSSKGVATAIPGLVRYLRATRPAAVLSTLAHANVALVAAKRLAGVSTRVYLREASTPSQVATPTFDLRGQGTELMKRSSYRLADGVVAVSKGAATDIREFLKVPAERLHIIYNPVVDASIAELAKAPLEDGWFERGMPPVVLGVGRLGPEKDFETLIRAFAEVRSQRDVRLLILGEGVLRGQLEHLVKTLDLSDHVRLPGFVDNPFAYMARAALFVLSSVREGLPGVLIQAMACGCPVVATDCPSGPAEILEGGEHGELVAMRDVPALAAAIERSLDAPTDSEALVARAATFSVERSITAYERLLLGDRNTMSGRREPIHEQSSSSYGLSDRA